MTSTQSQASRKVLTTKHRVYLIVGSLLLILGVLSTVTSLDMVVLEERQEEAEKARQDVIDSVLIPIDQDYGALPDDVPVYIVGRVASHKDGSRDRSFVGSSGLWLNGLRLPVDMRFMYNTPGTMESQGALGCVKDGALVPFEAPKVFDRNGKSLKIIGVGNCTSRLLGEFDPRQFLLERLVLPEDDIAVTAQQYYFRVLFGPVLILVSLVFFVSSFRGYHNPADAPLL